VNSRERFLAAMRFRPPDAVPMPCLFQRFEAETIRRWNREGLPRDTRPVEYFGFERCEYAPVSLGLFPAGEATDAAEAREWEMGDRLHEDEAVARSDEVKVVYPLRQREQWASFAHRLNPQSPGRYPRFWDDWARHRRAARDYPLGICLDGPLSSLREWMGASALGRAWREDRSWVEEMVRYLGDFAVAAAGRAVRDVRPDFAVVREASAYRYPSVAPAESLSEILSPWYRGLSDFLAAGGVEVRIVEAPGNVAELIQLWVASGFNGLCFAEVAAGLDVRAIRGRYGRDLSLIGNLDEGALRRSRRDVADELLAKGRLVAEGGYIPTPDRPVSSEVEFEDYEHYLTSLRKLS
jgi:hypothetical protein